MPWSIRQAIPIDRDVIVDFNLRLAWESEGKKLSEETLNSGVAAGLADANKALYFLAENEAGAIAGQIMVTFEWSDWRNGWIWWIQSVYVPAEFRRQGVFRALFHHVKETAEKSPNVIGLRLYVDNDNHSAQRTYYQMGMEKSNYFVIEKYPL